MSGLKNAFHQQESVKVITIEDVLFATYINMVNGVCDIDKNVLEGNYNVLMNTPVEENRISLSISLYLASHINSILVGLVFNHDNALQLFAEALDAEVNLDKTGKYDRLAERRKVSTNKIADKDHSIEIGLSVFSNKVMQRFMDLAVENHQAFGKEFGKVFTKQLDSLSNEDKQMLSIILSSYGYLIRAFNNNGEFLDKVISMVSSVEAKYIGK